MQIVVRHRGIPVNAQQVSLQLIARRLQRILQLAQRTGRFGKRQLTAGNRRPASLYSAICAISSFTCCCCSSMMRWVDRYCQIPPPNIFQWRVNVAMPVELIATLRCRIRRAFNSPATIDNCADAA